MDLRLLSEVLNSTTLVYEEKANFFPMLLASFIKGDIKLNFEEEKLRNRAYIWAPDMAPYYNVDDLSIPEGSIAVIPIRGEIIKYGWWNIGSLMMVDFIKMANSNPKIKSILLVIDSPGGTVSYTDILAQEVRNSEKPVIAFIEGVCASAAYWIASGAKKIISNSNLDIIGSIGTASKFTDFQPYYESLGVKFHDFNATKSPDKNKDIKEIRAGKYENYTKNILDPITEQFHSDVITGRAEINQKECLTGKVFLGPEALKYGLIDEIGNIDYALDAARNIEISEETFDHETETNLNQITMKKILLTGLVAFAALFSKKAEGEMEFSQEDANIANAELQSRADQIASLTTERDNLANEKATLADAKTKAESDLEAANTKITSLEEANEQLTADNTELKTKAGSGTSKSVVAADKEGDETEDADVKFCATHTAAENVAYMRSKRNAKKA